MHRLIQPGTTDSYKAKRPTIPIAPASPAPTIAVGSDAPPEEDEEEPEPEPPPAAEEDAPELPPVWRPVV